MKKYILSFSILVSSMFFSVAIISAATAQSNSAPSDAFSNLTYPITELGGCTDRDNCKIYCDNDVNTAACINYAEKYKLLSEEELKVVKNFITSGYKGPGDCTGKKECQAYCEDKSHIDECVSYAEEKGLMSVQELQKAKKVQAAIKKGVKFPSCNTKKECDTYCEDSSHMEECITFAKEAGLLSDEELQNSQKVLTAVKQGVKPPPCKGKDACDIYCAEASHADECVNFAVAAGIVTSEEARIIKETGGKGPGGCKNKSECNSYCSNEANREACMKFATKHNIPQPQPPQQPEQPNQGGGPNEGQGFNPGSGKNAGGQGQSVNPNPVKCIDDCESVGNDCLGKAGEKSKVCASKGQYCSQVTCETFGAGGTRPTTQEEWNRCASYCRTIEDNCYAGISPTDSACRTTKSQCVTQCQKASKPAEPAQPPGPTQPGQPGQPPQPGQSGQNQPTFSQPGPGGCKTPEECTTYCQSHPEAKAECQQFKQSQKPAQPSPPNQPTSPQPPSPPTGSN